MLWYHILSCHFYSCYRYVFILYLMVSYHIFLPWCPDQITEKFSLHSEQIRPHVNAIKSFFSWPCAWKKELCFASISLFSRPLHVLFFFHFLPSFSFRIFLRASGLGTLAPIVVGLRVPPNGNKAVADSLPQRLISGWLNCLHSDFF